MIVIAAATGSVGQSVARELIRLEHPVRVLTRDAARAEQSGDTAEIAVVDFDDPATLARAFDGATRAFIASGVSPRQVQDEKALIEAASTAGVDYAVKLSVLGAGGDFPVVVQQWNTEIEDAFRASGLTGTIIRPATYIKAVTTAVAPFIEAGVWGGAAGDGKAAFIDPADVGIYAGRLLADPPHTTPGEIDVVDLTGPEALSMDDVRRALAARSATDVAYTHRTVDEQRAVLEAMGLPPVRVDVLLGLDEMTHDGIMATVSSAFRTLVGRQPTSLPAWLGSGVAR